MFAGTPKPGFSLADVLPLQGPGAFVPVDVVNARADDLADALREGVGDLACCRMPIFVLAVPGVALAQYMVPAQCALPVLCVVGQARHLVVGDVGVLHDFLQLEVSKFLVVLGHEISYVRVYVVQADLDAMATVS